MTVLTVVMYDTFRTQLAIVHENSWLPYKERLVRIELTPEQEELLKPRILGTQFNTPVFEERGPIYLESTSELLSDQGERK